MSKDTIKRWILTQEQIDAYKHYVVQEHITARESFIAKNPFILAKWNETHSSPLPNPVEIPSDEEIDNLYYIIPKHDFDDSIMDRDTYVLEQNCRREAVKHFKKKILNLNI